MIEMPKERSDLKYWLALLRTPSVGTKTFIKLINKFSDLSEIFLLTNKRWITKFISEEAANYLANPDWASVEKDLTWATKPHHHLVTFEHEHYPKYLKEISDPPLVLYVNGFLDSLNTAQIAIVGSRNPSFSGRENAFQFANQLAKHGFTITSGLARGIDSASHQGALQAESPTIAVLGSGIDYIYPKENTALAEKITQQGAIISEFPPGTPPLPKHFPQRNRIISGLSQGVLIVEAAMQSGSLVTARLANEQGREVFAIPGSIHNTLSKGCHHLIREGAKLAETAHDILEELGLLLHHSVEKQPEIITFSNIKQEKVWNSLDTEPISIDTLVMRSGLTVSEVSSIVLDFETTGLIAYTQTGYVRSMPRTTG